MFGIVLINVAVNFLQGCHLEKALMTLLDNIDIICTILFLTEMVVKQHTYGFKKYWCDPWNILDGSVTLLSLPSLLIYFIQPPIDLNLLITLRLLRIFKIIRSARHFPNLPEIWNGFKLALRQSAAFLIAYCIIIVVIAMINSVLFGNASPTYFKNPLDSIYTLFQFFTIEGWYEIPNAVAGDLNPFLKHLVRLYFCLLLIGGGIIGMSLINSIFVDAMLSDNNNELIDKMNELKQQMSEQQESLEKKIEHLQEMLKDKGV